MEYCRCSTASTCWPDAYIYVAHIMLAFVTFRILSAFCRVFHFFFMVSCCYPSRGIILCLAFSHKNKTPQTDHLQRYHDLRLSGQIYS